VLRRLGREERTFFGKWATRARWTLVARTPALQGSGESRRCEAADASPLLLMARPFYSSGCRWWGPAVSSRPSLPLYHCTPVYEYSRVWLRVLDAQVQRVRMRRPVAALQWCSTCSRSRENARQATAALRFARGRGASGSPHQPAVRALQDRQGERLGRSWPGSCP